MLYPETFKQATRLAASTKELIERDQGVLQPMNYTIWYNYAANHHPDMKKEIDALLAAEGAISQAQYEEIFSRYFGIDETGIEVLATARSASDTVGRVQAEQRDAAEHTRGYGDNLEGINGDLVEGMSAEELRATAQRVLKETIQVAKKTEALERELTTATKEIGALQTHLEEVTKDALTDPLTGLANRKKFDSDLRIWTKHANDTGEPVSLIMADIDHFKSFNDNYGHKVGDLALRSVARVLSLSIKGQDTAARYGGEEFAIILPKTSLSNAATVAEQLRSTLSSKELTHRATGKNYGSVTLSIGIAEWAGKQSIPELIDCADKALYRAKEAGRNRVMMEQTKA